MSARQLIVALGLVVVAGGGFAAFSLNREEPLPAPELAEELDCTSCDARAASKARQREALKKARDEARE